MNTMQESKKPAPIFIGRWTPRILFSLKERPRRHGELRRRLGSISQRTHCARGRRVFLRVDFVRIGRLSAGRRVGSR
jgi:hypothetical protein